MRTKKSSKWVLPIFFTFFLFINIEGNESIADQVVNIDDEKRDACTLLVKTKNDTKGNNGRKLFCEKLDGKTFPVVNIPEWLHLKLNNGEIKDGTHTLECTKCESIDEVLLVNPKQADFTISKSNRRLANVEPTISPMPSSVPSSAPSEYFIEFRGAASVVSYNRGVIELEWNEPSVNDPNGGSLLVYDVFVARGSFDFPTLNCEIPKGDPQASVEDLIEFFDNAGEELSRTQTSDRRTIVTSPFVDETVSVLVTARIPDLAFSNFDTASNSSAASSQNRRADEILVSPADPVVKDGINVVEIDGPSNGFNITEEDDYIDYSGKVPPNLLTLNSNDFINGSLDEGASYIRQVDQIEVISSSEVRVHTKHMTYADIFDVLHFDAYFDPLDDSDEGNTRRKLQSTNNVIDYEKGFSHVSGNANFRGQVSLDFRVRTTFDIDTIGPRPSRRKATLSVDAEINATLSLSYDRGEIDQNRELINLLNPSRFRFKIFFIGFIPVFVLHRPRMNVEVETGGTLEEPITVGFEGGADFGAKLSDKGEKKIKGEYFRKRKGLDFDVGGNLDIAGEVATSVCVDARIYGMLQLEVCGRAGMDHKMTVEGTNQCLQDNNFLFHAKKLETNYFYNATTTSRIGHRGASSDSVEYHRETIPIHQYNVTTQGDLKNPMECIFCPNDPDQHRNLRYNDVPFEGGGEEQEGSFFLLSTPSTTSKRLDYTIIEEITDTYNNETCPFPLPTPDTPPEIAFRHLNSHTSKCGGDPHFFTWNNNEHYSYHGECDLIFVKSENFGNGRGLELHIRTELSESRTFSYISSVALKIGANVLELNQNGDLYLNNRLNPEYPFELSGYEVTEKEDGGIDVKVDDKLGSSSISISLRTNRKANFMAVKVSGQESHFYDSVGLMGSWYEKAVFSRDGSRRLLNSTKEAYGEEWQVRDTDPMIFQEARFPQYPEVCKMNEKRVTGRRHLHAIERTLFEASCAKVKDEIMREMCIEDAILTGDLDMADDPFYIQ